MDLAHVHQALLDSYRAVGGINHLDGTNLPSRDSIDRLADSIMHLLFPGYFETSCLRSQELSRMIEKRLTYLQWQLLEEIQKCLVFAGHLQAETQSCEVTRRVLEALPGVRSLLQTDVEAAYLGDPAARSYEEIILSYPGILAIALQRIAHLLYKEEIQLLPRMLTEFAHRRTGIDIHPGAVLGSHFFIDHGTGVVIGETATIGHHVKLYQGVTLGAKSFATDDEGNPVKGIKRHPDIGDHVTIYAGATVLGGDTQVGSHSIIGSSVWLMKSIPERSIAYYKGESLIVRSRRPHEEAEGE